MLADLPSHASRYPLPWIHLCMFCVCPCFVFSCCVVVRTVFRRCPANRFFASKINARTSDSQAFFFKSRPVASRPVAQRCQAKRPLKVNSDNKREPNAFPAQNPTRAVARKIAPDRLRCSSHSVGAASPPRRCLAPPTEPAVRRQQEQKGALCLQLLLGVQASARGFLLGEMAGLLL